MNGVLTAHGLEDYEHEVLNRLLRLRQENPWLWSRMAIQVHEEPGARELSLGSMFHWVDQRVLVSTARN